MIGTSERVIKNHLRSTFDKLGASSRMELAMHVANPAAGIGPSQTGAPTA